MKDFFALYDRLIGDMDTDALVTDTLCGQCWTAVKTDGHFGMAMTTPVDTAPRMMSGSYRGMPIKELAQAAKSWNLTEAGIEDAQSAQVLLSSYAGIDATDARADSLRPYEAIVVKVR